jgi:hypothetical protein
VNSLANKLLFSQRVLATVICFASIILNYYI